MYLQGRGHQHFGPGTSMVQFIQPNQFYGMGCVCDGGCGAPLEQAGRGMGCACGGQCCGMGLFDSGLDLTQWGWPEIVIAGLALWGLASVFSTGKRTASAVGGAVRRRRSKSARRAKLQRELSEV